MKQIIHRRTTCRACGSRAIEHVFSLKPSPIGDAYVTAERLGVEQPTYPLDLCVCANCGLAQIIDVIDPDVLYGDYIYVTGSSLGLPDHFLGYAQSVIKRCGLKAGSLVIDIGSNDGTLLASFKSQGMEVLGIEPAAHIAAQANARGVRTVNAFLAPEVAGSVASEYGRATLITSNNVFANIDDLGSWMVSVEKLLADDGIYVFESFYLADVINNMVFDFLYHEHLSAFSVRPIKWLFEHHGLELIAVEHVSTKGGSLRYFAQRPGGPMRDDGSVAAYLASEDAAGLYKKQTYVAYAEKIDHLKSQTRDFLAEAKRSGKSVAGFGASITGTTLIYHFELGDYIDYLVDDNPAKQGRYSPGLHLPVLASTALYERKPDYVVALAWRFAEPFMGKHQRYIDGGGQFVVPVPDFRIVGRGA